MTKDLTKPITEIKQTLSETADAVKKSIEPTTNAVNKTVDDVRSAGKVQWVGAEPKTGVSPGDAWDGMGDSVPDEVAAAPSEHVEEPGERGRLSGRVVTGQVEEARQPIMAHLVELRDRLIKVSIAVVLGSIIAFFFREQILDILQEPYSKVTDGPEPGVHRTD